MVCSLRQVSDLSAFATVFKQAGTSHSGDRNLSDAKRAIHRPRSSKLGARNPRACGAQHAANILLPPSPTGAHLWAPDIQSRQIEDHRSLDFAGRTDLTPLTGLAEVPFQARIRGNRMNLKAIARPLAIAMAAALPAAAFAQEEPLPESGEQLVQDLHAAFGNHHARAVHAKGVILNGHFEPTAAARKLSRAALFESATEVTVRFSNFTGFPDIPDNDPNANPRGMAISFGPQASSMLDVVTHNFDGFPTRTAAEFGQLLRAIGSSGAGVAAPTPLDIFLASHPLAKIFLTTQHPAPISYATTSYFGVNAVTFTDRSGRSRAVRYRFVPAVGEAYFNTGPNPGLTADYLRPEIAKRVGAGPIQFDWYAQIGEKGDIVDDPSVAWPRSRALVKLGTITIDRLAANTPEEDRNLTFSPGRMPDGIEAADPMLGLRGAAYPVSFRERQNKSPQ